jgi:DNA-binding transcriptional LysR family regulator
MDQLTGILAFVRTAESRSFAQAARLLDVTPSGVSKSVARLETQLGLRLLHRTTRQVSLTDDGAVFFEHCRRLLDDFDAARSLDRKSTRLNSSHNPASRMPSSA